MLSGRRLVLDKRLLRALAIGMFAFPEPVVSHILGMTLLVVSFLVPGGVEGWANAATCRCDYHRRRLPAVPALGLPFGSLVNVPGRQPCAQDTRDGFIRNRYGFTMVEVPTLAARAWFDRVAPSRGQTYAWQTWPRLEGTLLRRVSGFGASAAVKCEPGRALTGART